VAFIPHRNVRELIRSHPVIADAFWRDTLVDAAVFREWMVGLGRRSAYTRMAHLFCELMMRYRAIGLASDDSFKLSANQAELGDALGLSTVHVNRTLMNLRGDRLITLEGGVLSVLDWERLKEAAEFDLTYLHLEDRHAA
jgi:CRP-like cAMP-binding protein